MTEVTLKAIEELLDQKLDEKLDKKLEPIHAILNNHTAILDKLLLKDKTKQDSSKVTEHRIDRLETWGQKVGRKVGIKFEL